MTEAVLDELPGFRRRFRITPEPGRICCEVEDDYHCMTVVVNHDGSAVTSIEPGMRRVPWTTCPGAEEQLKQTFTGVPLEDFASRGEKKRNCTHLYDLALLAANHFHDSDITIYDLLVSDPIDGVRLAEIRKNGDVVLSWSESGFKITAPAEIAGTPLFDMRTWISSLEGERQEYARLLQWGNMLANGRSIPLENQSDATKMPPNCYTFQPERAKTAKRVGEIRDFSAEAKDPLADYQAFL